MTCDTFVSGDIYTISIAPFGVHAITEFLYGLMRLEHHLTNVTTYL